MTRPAHIAPLDAALDENLARLAEAEKQQAHIVAQYADALREVQAAQKARSDAYYAARNCEDAIKRLGYCVLAPGGANGGIVPKGASRLDNHSGNFCEPVTQDGPDA